MALSGHNTRAFYAVLVAVLAICTSSPFLTIIHHTSVVALDDLQRVALAIMSLPVLISLLRQSVVSTSAHLVYQAVRQAPSLSVNTAVVHVFAHPFPYSLKALASFLYVLVNVLTTTGSPSDHRMVQTIWTWFVIASLVEPDSPLSRPIRMLDAALGRFLHQLSFAFTFVQSFGIAILHRATTTIRLFVRFVEALPVTACNCAACIYEFIQCAGIIGLAVAWILLFIATLIHLAIRFLTALVPKKPVWVTHVPRAPQPRPSADAYPRSNPRLDQLYVPRHVPTGSASPTDIRRDLRTTVRQAGLLQRPDNLLLPPRRPPHGTEEEWSVGAKVRGHPGFLWFKRESVTWMPLTQDEEDTVLRRSSISHVFLSRQDKHSFWIHPKSKNIDPFMVTVQELGLWDKVKMDMVKTVESNHGRIVYASSTLELEPEAVPAQLPARDDRELGSAGPTNPRRASNTLNFSSPSAARTLRLKRTMFAGIPRPVPTSSHVTGLTDTPTSLLFDPTPTPTGNAAAITPPEDVEEADQAEDREAFPDPPIMDVPAVDPVQPNAVEVPESVLDTRLAESPAEDPVTMPADGPELHRIDSQETSVSEDLPITPELWSASPSTDSSSSATTALSESLIAELESSPSSAESFSSSSIFRHNVLVLSVSEEAVKCADRPRWATLDELLRAHPNDPRFEQDIVMNIDEVVLPDVVPSFQHNKSTSANANTNVDDPVGLLDATTGAGENCLPSAGLTVRAVDYRDHPVDDDSLEDDFDDMEEITDEDCEEREVFWDADEDSDPDPTVVLALAVTFQSLSLHGIPIPQHNAIAPSSMSTTDEPTTSLDIGVVASATHSADTGSASPSAKPSRSVTLNPVVEYVEPLGYTEAAEEEQEESPAKSSLAIHSGDAPATIADETDVGGTDEDGEADAEAVELETDHSAEADDEEEGQADDDAEDSDDDERHDIHEQQDLPLNNPNNTEASDMTAAADAHLETGAAQTLTDNFEAQSVPLTPAADLGDDEGDEKEIKKYWDVQHEHHDYEQEAEQEDGEEDEGEEEEEGHVDDNERAEGKGEDVAEGPVQPVTEEKETVDDIPAPANADDGPRVHKVEETCPVKPLPRPRIKESAPLEDNAVAVMEDELAAALPMPTEQVEERQFRPLPRRPDRLLVAGVQAPVVATEYPQASEAVRAVKRLPRKSELRAQARVSEDVKLSPPTGDFQFAARGPALPFAAPVEAPADSPPIPPASFSAQFSSQVPAYVPTLPLPTDMALSGSEATGGVFLFESASSTSFPFSSPASTKASEMALSSLSKAKDAEGTAERVAEDPSALVRLPPKRLPRRLQQRPVAAPQVPLSFAALQDLPSCD